MSTLVYFDTSAVAKWYLNEPRSEDVEQYLQNHGPVAVSWLTIVEMRSLLARRRRKGDFGPEIEWRVFATFEEDLRAGHLVLHESRGDIVAAAVRIIGELNEIALRTLDALHLALARGLSADSVATADRVMAEATQRLGFGLISFQ
jgi:predicted nucleic acid-binding protein